MEKIVKRLMENHKLNESVSNEDLYQALEDNDISWKVAYVLDDGTAYVVTQAEILSGDELEDILRPAGFTKGYTILRDYSGYNPDQDIEGYKTGIKRNYWGPRTTDMFGYAFGIEKEDRHYAIYLGDEEVESNMTLELAIDYIEGSYEDSEDYIIVDTNDGNEYTFEDLERMKDLL